jgi:nicotinate phosphoribosyltransferase
MKIYNGHERLPRNYTLMTDEYEFTMANGYLMNNKQDDEAVFDVFFRKVPNNGGYAVMAGLDKVIPFIQGLKFDEREIDYFRRKGYNETFLNYLKNFKFTGSIYAIPDGTPVFPNEPLVTVKAPLIEAQIVETALLSIINGAMEHATGARRIVEATPNGIGVMEFGSRRADGNEAAIDASIYGIMAGCIGTSNALAADMLNMKGMGTQAHSWIESYDSEYEAFLAYAKAYPDNCILLVDTIDTLRSGVPNAIRVAQDYLIPNGYRLKGIRIDSGDLAYLSKETRKMLDEAGLTDAGICLSNGLTAETIESLVQQGASFTSLGVGDNISKPEGRMGCVYKEVALRENGVFIPKIKLSNDIVKIINPDYKKLYRAYDKDTGYAIADIMTCQNEQIKKEDLIIVSPTNYLVRNTINNFDLVELQIPIFIDGKLVYNDPDILDKQKYCNAQMATIYPEVKRTKMPQEYYVDGTEEYVNFKNEIINNTKKLVIKK